MFNETYICNLFSSQNFIFSSINNIFKLDDELDIFKIGKYNVEQKIIYHPVLGSKILLDTYYLIEGGEDKKIDITIAKDRDIVLVSGEFIKENKDIYYDPNLIYDNEKLFVNIRFFNLLIQLSLKKLFNLPELDKVKLEYTDAILQKRDKLVLKDLIDIIKMNLDGFIYYI